MPIYDKNKELEINIVILNFMSDLEIAYKMLNLIENLFSFTNLCYVKFIIHIGFISKYVNKIVYEKIGNVIALCNNPENSLVLFQTQKTLTLCKNPENSFGFIMLLMYLLLIYCFCLCSFDGLGMVRGWFGHSLRWCWDMLNSFSDFDRKQMFPDLDGSFEGLGPEY